MSTSDTSEKGLETLIMRHLTGVDGLASGAPPGVAEPAPATGEGEGGVQQCRVRKSALATRHLAPEMR